MIRRWTLVDIERETGLIIPDTESHFIFRSFAKLVARIVNVNSKYRRKYKAVVLHRKEVENYYD